MSRYNIGDTIIIDGKEGTVINEGMRTDDLLHQSYLIRFKNDNPDLPDYSVWYRAGELPLKENHDSEDYHKGMTDAWNFIIRLYSDSYTRDDLEAIFGVFYIDSIMKKYTVEEAMQKIKEYEQKQIHVNDIVRFMTPDGERNGIVTRINAHNIVTVISHDGNSYTESGDKFTKTGRQIDISSVLEELNWNKPAEIPVYDDAAGFAEPNNKKNGVVIDVGKESYLGIMY